MTNQPPTASDRNLWQDDPLLRSLVSASELETSPLDAYGGILGSFGMREAARDANRNMSELQQFDAGGRRLDEVRFHPAYRQFMATSIAAGCHSIAWEGGRDRHLAQACMVYLASQVEPDDCCTLTMTNAAIPVLLNAGANLDHWPAKLLSREYDPSLRPLKAKRGATLGMAITEKQGGSDVRSNTTRAEFDGDAWRLTGHNGFAPRRCRTGLSPWRRVRRD